jgi:hypothetical protein
MDPEGRRTLASRLGSRDNRVRRWRICLVSPSCPQEQWPTDMARWSKMDDLALLERRDSVGVFFECEPVGER